MTATLFNICNAIVLPGWLLLIVAPRWKWTTRVASIAIPILLSLTYIVLMATHLPALASGLSRLEDIGRLFGHPDILLAGWLHYLAFDLFIGAWQVRAAQRANIPHWLVVPCLLLTLMLGPTGLVAFYLLRWMREQRSPLGSLKAAATECYRRSRPLTVAGGALLAAVAPLMVLSAVDSRSTLGVNVWAKPIKFSASLGVYFLTLAWLLGHLPGPRGAVRAIAWVTVACLSCEMPILFVQAVRGVPSHFNTSTPFDRALYLTMGAAACTQVVLLGAALLLFCTVRTGLPRLYLYGIRAGMALLLLGIAPGLVMVAQGQHSVGATDGGAGLPVLNWSTLGGDLRIAHFLGLHALQVLPAAGYWLSRLPPTYGRARWFAFAQFSAAYAVVLVAVFAQALLGQPLLHHQLSTSEARVGGVDHF